MRFFPAAVAALVLASAPLPALGLWRHPEAAEKHALFFNAQFAGISFADGFAFGPGELSFDFLPFPLPLSAGAYFKFPDPNLKSFGARLAYHIDIRDAKTDLYFLYVFDCGFLRNAELEYYGDGPQPLRFYDFRAGVRRLFGKFLCLTAETDYKFSGLGLGLSIKLN
jgi:hypothetical protein